MTTGEDRNKDRFKKWKLCGLWKLPFRHHGAIKLTQKCVCFTNTCINPFVPTFVSREYHPKVLERQQVAVYVRSLAENTGLSVLRDKLPQPFQSRFLFLRGRTQQKTDQMRGEDPVEKIHACSTNSSGKSKRLSRSCSSQQWHLKKRLACALTH